MHKKRAAPLDTGLDNLRHREGQRPHEVVAFGPVPVPHCNRQPLRLVAVFQIADECELDDMTKEKINKNN